MKYFKLIAFTYFFALSFISLNAQIFTVSEVDATEFPKLKASFKAEDLNGKPYPNLVPADFLVREGTYYPPDLDVFCEIREIDPEVSVLLVIDQSNSMKTKDTATGQERIELVKEGATLFVNTLKFVGRTTVGITTFGKVVVLECPFTNDKKRLTDSIKTISPGGGTDYNPPFLDMLAGADTLLRTRDPAVRRVVIFLTDGRPEILPVLTDSIINVMRRANIQVYGITFTLPMNKELDAIAKQTGGDSYECYTKEQLNNIYSLIALDIQSKQFCQLSWTAPYGCTEQSIYREAEITFLRPTTPIHVLQPYQAPQNSIAQVLTQKVVSFDDPEPGPQNAVRKDIILKPIYSSFTVNGVSINPNTHFRIVNWGGQPPPFTIDTGQTRTITVEFTQIGGKDIRQAAFIIDGDPCPPLITLVGGLSQVLIAEPNGGEVFSTCEDVDIIWTGVEPDIPVKLSYSSDAGTTWTVIDAAAKGLRYRWKPPVTGIKFLVKAEVADVMQYQWANKAGGTTNDAGRSIALQDDGLYYYITGHFEGSATFDTKVVNSSGLKDAYIAKYGNQGNIAWIEKVGSAKQDSANGVCVDPAGNAYITGTCFKGVQFGSNTPFMQYDNKAYCFVAKYAPDGGTPSIGLLGPIDKYTTFEAWGLKVRFENGYTIVRGQYINEIKYPDGKFLPKANPATPGTFTATFDTDMFMTKLEQNGTLYPDYSTDFDLDKDGNRFSTGAFTGTRQFGQHTITSNGGSDVYVNKWGKTPGSIDMSDGTFIVDQPKYEFIPNTVNLGNCTLGSSVSQVYSGLLKNTGRIEIKILNAGLVGTAKDDFVIISGLDSIFSPNETMDVEIAFKPTATGVRNAQYVLNDGCINPVILDINGTGICSGITVSPNECGTQNIGKYKDVLVPCIFKNTNNSTIRLTPTLKGNHPGDFKLLDENSNLISGQVPVPPDACFNMIIRFEPTAPGLREAIIDFGMPSGCEYKESLVSGTGIDTDILVEDMDWKERRILTVNDTTIALKNNSSLPATLTNIELENPVMTVFSVVNQSRVIPANDTIHIHVAFTPDQEIDYSNKLLLTFDVMQTKLPVNLHGVGVLPRIEAKWTCAEPVLPGESSVAYLNVANTSANAPLYIESIDFAQTSVNYSWVSGSKPQNIVIQPNNNQDFAVTFHPVKPGTISEDVIIRSDATTGPEKNPIIETIVKAECDALGIVIDSPIDFGTVLLCENFSKQIVVKNSSGGTSVFITGYHFTNADSVAFKPLIPDNYEIPPYDQRLIYINFNPPEIKRYETKLVLENSIGFDLSIDLIGEGDVIHFYTPAMDVKIEPGFPYRVPVYADIPKLSTGNVTDISLEVLYDDNIVFYDDQTGLTNVAPGWQWSNSTDEPGIIKINGTGDLSTPWKNQLFSLDFKIYLGESASSSIYFNPVNKDCVTPDTLGTTFHLDNVCFLDGRLITISPNRFALKTPTPSPASDKFTLDFTVALECTTQIELINIYGDRQLYLVNEKLNRGQYILDYSTRDIPSGTYFIRMFSGPFSATQKIIITK